MRALTAAAVVAASLALPATAATPTFVVGSSAVVSPKRPSYLPEPYRFRSVKRVATGVYCLATAQSWKTHTPLVSPLPELSPKGAPLVATWVAGGKRCGSSIEVRTYRVAGNSLRPANTVAFHVLVGGAD